MTFLDKIILNDKELFIYLNSLGNENWDTFWIVITDQLSWIPLYLLFLYLIFKAFGWKKGLLFLILTAILIAFSDQFANFSKNLFERLRPNRDPSINQYIRILKNSGSYSFYSAHAATSTAVTSFMFLTLKKNYNYTYLFFIWPILFAYSRVYVGVHFPIDIIFGTFMGFLIGIIYYKISMILLKKYN
ncbi:MAG: phosphatase PAP2 family protein [Bacteroidota bacterium]